MPADPPRPPGLGPHCVGTRVVLRRVLPGLTGPSGGPAMTDLLGVMVSWGATSTVLRAEDGATTEIELAHVVSGKPVPPRPSLRMRVPAEQACVMANLSWPPVHTEEIGDWLLRASGGFSARANSVMAVGDPGLPFAEAVERAVAFYAEHDLPAWAQVVVGSATADRFAEAGWETARPGEADSQFHLAPVAQALRAARRLVPAPAPEVRRTDAVSEAWLAVDDRARAHPDDARRVLEGPPAVVLAEVPAGPADASLVAKGRAGGQGDWAGVTDVWVSPDHRRRGLGLVVVADLLEWAAEQGATTAYLQVRGDNAAALALYDRLGFRQHHTYRYLARRPPATATTPIATSTNAPSISSTPAASEAST